MPVEGIEVCRSGQWKLGPWRNAPRCYRSDWEAVGVRDRGGSWSRRRSIGIAAFVQAAGASTLSGGSIGQSMSGQARRSVLPGPPKFHQLSTGKRSTHLLFTRRASQGGW